LLKILVSLTNSIELQYSSSRDMTNPQPKVTPRCSNPSRVRVNNLQNEVSNEAIHGSWP